MSLFEDDRYQYCDTFFVFFDESNRPSVDQVVSALQSGGEKYELQGSKGRDGQFEAITVRSPHDSSAMDITIVTGEEVREQVEELVTELRNMSLNGDDFQKLKKVNQANARLDVYHFERKSDSPEDAVLDPGGLFLVLEKLNAICDGVGHDPQSKTLI
ncbi:MAG: hypothetical protein AAFN77_12300 [Planctomycetota bacterium]